jgi:serine/threonine-protein kinase ULK/ATG1
VVSMDSRSGSTHSREQQAASNNIMPNNMTTQESSRSSSSKMIAGYAIRGRLGSGSFASVFRGVRDPTIASAPEHTYPTQEVVAIKAISRSEKLSKKILENLEIEISILRNYRHPNIVEMYHVEKTRGHYYLILEFCAGGDLQRLIRSRKTGRLSEKLTRRLFRDLASGLRFLYERQLIHRDIKPQNLLLSGVLPLDELEDEAKDANDEEKRRQEKFPTERFSLKIADFGFARHLQSTSLAETLCGSPLYMAPEILQHQRWVSPQL